MGITKAAVLPDPVRAMPTTSWPCRISGIARRWMGVGSRYPFRFRAWKSGGYSSSASNEPAFAFLLPFLRLALRWSAQLRQRGGALAAAAHPTASSPSSSSSSAYSS